jgi:protein phosphatase
LETLFMSKPPTDPQIILIQPTGVNDPATGQSTAVRSFGISDIGKERQSNEDDFLIAELTRTIRVWQSKLPQPQAQDSAMRGHVFMVADGMGGHKAGEVASFLAVSAVEAFLLHAFRSFSRLYGLETQSVLGELETALCQADAKVLEAAQSRPEYRGMGTTLTLAYVQGWQLFLAHVGDSRCYLFRQGQLSQLTRDHTLVAELVRRGAIGEEEASEHHFRHIVSNVVGGAGSNFEVELRQLDLEPGDVLLLCTDGLTGMLPHEEARGILEAEQDPQPACERLVAEANGWGGRDNITVIVARFESPG